MRALKDLFQLNRGWAARMREQDPEFFARLAELQTPQFLWVGCADSRVPANQIVGLKPGEVFVHRNVANLVVHTDLNCLSVLQYAVDVLKVRHIIVCGHYGCGGVRAAAEGAKFGLIDNWLRHIQDVATKHRAELDSIEDERARMDRLCELNVVEQVSHVCRTTIVEDAWARGQNVAVHGWVYALEDGHLRDTQMTVTNAEELARVYGDALASRPLGPEAE